MVDKEFTQICKEILEFNTKFQEIKTEILQSANGVEANTALVASNKQRIDEVKSDMDAKKADFDEKYPVLERLESQIEPTTQNINEFNRNKSSFDSDFSIFSTKNSEFLEKMADFNTKYTSIDIKHSETLQKADEVDTNKRLFDVDFSKFKSDFEGLNDLLTSLERLKTDIQSVLEGGVINDSEASSLQTYSSRKIAEILAQKQSELDLIIQSINQKISNLSDTADNEKSVLEATKLSSPRTINGVSFDGTTDITITDDTKLGKDEQAKDSALLEGRAVSEFAASTHNHDEAYLGKEEVAADSAKLGGSPAEDYLKKVDANFVTTDTLATEQTAGIVKLKNTINGSAEDSAVTQNAVKTYVDNKQQPSLGIGQTWQEVLSSREIGVTYTNTTNKPMMVVIAFESKSDNSLITVYVNSTRIIEFDMDNTINNSFSFIVPPNMTYQISENRGLSKDRIIRTEHSSWAELK